MLKKYTKTYSGYLNLTCKVTQAFNCQSTSKHPLQIWHSKNQFLDKCLYDCDPSLKAWYLLNEMWQQ